MCDFFTLISHTKHTNITQATVDFRSWKEETEHEFLRGYFDEYKVKVVHLKQWSLVGPLPILANVYSKHKESECLADQIGQRL